AEGGAAIVTLGADGAVVAGPDGVVLHGRLYAQGPYPVGSGDAFLGGLVHALDRGDAWGGAVALALGAAAARDPAPRARRRAGRVRLDARARGRVRAGPVGRVDPRLGGCDEPRRRR